MFKIMILGRLYFLDRKEFGRKSIQVLDALFEKHECSKLYYLIIPLAKSRGSRFAPFA